MKVRQVSDSCCSHLLSFYIEGREGDLHFSNLEIHLIVAISYVYYFWLAKQQFCGQSYGQEGPGDLSRAQDHYALLQRLRRYFEIIDCITSLPTNSIVINMESL